MRVQIIGSGAVGMLVASFFADAGHDVTLVCRRRAQVLSLNEEGLTRVNVDGSLKVNFVNASEIVNAESDLLVIAVKSGQLQEVMAVLPLDIPMLFLQNGMAHLDVVKSMELEQVVFGSAQFGAMRDGDTNVIHRGIGVLKVASTMQGNRMLEMISELSNALFPVTVERDVEQMLFEKALLNCFINPLTALLQVKNGQLIENPSAYTLLKQLYGEMVQAFPKECVRFEMVEELCLKTSGNTSSMLADHLEKRRSEAPSIVGAVLQKARNKGSQIPTLNTLYQLILAKEKEGGFW